MTEYPITLIFNSKEEEDSYFLSKRKYIESLFFSQDSTGTYQDKLNEIREISEKKNEELILMQKQMELLMNKNTELEKIVDLASKSTSGESSVYKGEFGEKKWETIFKENMGDEYEIDGGKEMEKMDIRIKHLETSLVMGVETKVKKQLTKKDIQKFRRDKLKNDFMGSIFISEQCVINLEEKKIEKNGWHIVNNELYIYSSDKGLVLMLIKIFISNLLCSDESKYDMCKLVDMIKNYYNHTYELKKIVLNTDKSFIRDLRSLNISPANGHLYLVPQSKCKGTKVPY